MKSKEFNYRDLQDHIEVMIGKFGLQNSVKFLGRLIDNTEVASDKDARAKEIVELTIAKSIEVFDLEKDKFYQSDLTEYKDARMSCYYIIHKYTQISYGRISEIFQQKKRSVWYFQSKCEEMISIPKFYPKFMSLHTIVENYIINHISNLNS